MNILTGNLSHSSLFYYKNLPYKIYLNLVVNKFIRWIILRCILNGARNCGLDPCRSGWARQKTRVYMVMHFGLQKGKKFLDKANEGSLLSGDCNT